MNTTRALPSAAAFLRISHEQRQAVPFEWRYSLWKKLSGIVGLLAALVICAGCTTPNTAGFSQQSVGQTPTILVAGDVIKITFPGATELTQSQKIRADGKISLPLVGEVQAAGKPPGELQDELARLYKPQLQNNAVVVTVESGALTVVISGAVKQSAKVTFEKPTTVLEAIMEAGGFAPEADLKKVHLIRVVNGEHHTDIVDLRPALRGEPTRAIYLRDGDVVYVPERTFTY